MRAEAMRDAEGWSGACAGDDGEDDDDDGDGGGDDGDDDGYGDGGDYSLIFTRAIEN